VYDFRVIKRRCSTDIQKRRQMYVNKEEKKKVILKNRRLQRQPSLGVVL
jgi:hypothetical protein